MTEIEILKEANKYGFRLAITSIIVMFLLSIGIISGAYYIINDHTLNVSVSQQDIHNSNAKQEINNAKN